MRFTYEGPFDAVDVVISVPKGETIDIPEASGVGLLAQSGTWTPDKKALSTLTVPELEARAADLSVEVPSGAKKDDILTALLDHSTNPRDTTTEEL